MPAPLLARNGPAQQQRPGGEADMAAAAKRDGLHTFSELVSTGQVQNVLHVQCTYTVSSLFIYCSLHRNTYF